jgi:hypothetical protein
MKENLANPAALPIVQLFTTMSWVSGLTSPQANQCPSRVEYPAVRASDPALDQPLFRPPRQSRAVYTKQLRGIADAQPRGVGDIRLVPRHH